MEGPGSIPGRGEFFFNLSADLVEETKKKLAPRGIEPVTFALFFLSLFQCTKYLTIVKINIGS